MKKERVKYCDALRFWAIISVILIHIFADFRDSYLVQDRLYYFIIPFFDSITRMGVPIFFMLTGIFMLGSKKEESYMQFLKKRVSKLFIPFFFLSIVYYVYEGFKNNTSLSVLSFLNVFTSNQIKYHLWFMYTIILIYLVLPFVRKLVQNLDKKELRTLIFVIFSGNVLFGINFISESFDYNFFSSFIYSDGVRCLNYLFLGYYLYYYGISQKYHKKLYILGVLSILLMPILNYVTTKDIRNDGLLVAGSFLPFIASTAFFTFVKENYSKWKISTTIEKFFTFINPYIFYIYMAHVLVMEYVKKFLFKVFVPTNFGMTCVFMVIEFFFTFIGSCIVAYILNYLYNKLEKRFLKV